MDADQATSMLSDEALAFNACEQCLYDFRTDEGAFTCNYYECPYLPEELDVWCPTCRYNFMVDDGNPACGDPPDCDFAKETAPQRVAALDVWLRLRGS